MGQIERLKRITKARIEAFLDSLERPEVVFPQLIKELSAKLKEAVNAEAKSLSAVKADQRRFDEASGMVLRFGKAAELAVNSGDIDTAKHAISAQIRAEQKLDGSKKSLERSESAYTAARQVRVQFQENLNDLNARKNEILKRHRCAELHKQMMHVPKTDKQFSCSSIIEAVARMEAKVELDESRIEIQNEISKTLGSTFTVEKIANEDEVDRRLNELKKTKPKTTPHH